MIPGLKRNVFNLHDVMMYVAVARKHIRLMLLLLCFAGISGMVYYIYARPVYYARSLVKVDYLASPVDTETVFHDSRLNEIGAELRAPHIIERTARQFGVNESAKEIEHRYIKKLSIRVNSQQNLEVEVWPYVSSWGAKWTEVMVREFIKSREEQRIQYRENVAKNHISEMAEIRKRIDEDLNSKFSFRGQRNLTQAEIDYNRVREVPHELASCKGRLIRMESVRESLEEPNLDIIARLSLISSMDKEAKVTVGQQVNMSEKNPDSTNAENDTGQKETNPSIVVVPSVVNEPNPWEQAEMEQQRILAEIEKASKIYLPGHKKMLVLRKQLDDVNQQLELQYQVAKNRFDLEYQSLKNRTRQLEDKLPEYEKLSKALQKILQDSQLHDAGELAWNSMFKKLAQTVSTLDFVDGRERVNLEYLSLLQANENPISPSRGRLIFLSLFFGLALSFGIPFLIEYMDHTVSSFEQVETTFQIRGLGIIPKISNTESSRPVLLDLEDSDERNLVENFRVIRTNLLSIGALTKAPHVIMTTSSVPKEGKTVVSSNLAISFAQTGTKTLIIDADLRRGRLHRLFGFNKGPGLSNILLGQAKMEEALRPTGKENLTILTSGQHLETGTELLGSQKFADLMAEFRSRYDRIIIDTPPVLGLSETSILQNQVDGVLFVVWSGRTPLSNMKAAVEILQANGANFYGFVLNRLDLSSTSNYYQYYYYSNDYYHSYHALENA